MQLPTDSESRAFLAAIIILAALVSLLTYLTWTI